MLGMMELGKDWNVSFHRNENNMIVMHDRMQWPIPKKECDSLRLKKIIMSSNGSKIAI